MPDDDTRQRFIVNPYLPAVTGSAVVLHPFAYHPYYPAPHYFYDPRYVHDPVYDRHVPSPSGQIEPYVDPADMGRPPSADRDPVLYSSHHDTSPDDFASPFGARHGESSDDHQWQRPVKRRTDGLWEEEPVPKKSRMDDLPSSSLRRYKTYGYNESSTVETFDPYEPLPLVEYSRPSDLDFGPSDDTATEGHFDTLMRNDIGYDHQYDTPSSDQRDHQYSDYVPQVDQERYDALFDERIADIDYEPEPTQSHTQQHIEYAHWPTPTERQDVHDRAIIDRDDTMITPGGYDEDMISHLTPSSPLHAATPSSFRYPTPPHSRSPVRHIEDSFDPQGDLWGMAEDNRRQGLSPAVHAGHEPRTTQWRVGKTPGHQGSHVRKDDEDIQSKTGTEVKTLAKSITGSTAQVIKTLKKPFQQPRVVLAPARYGSGRQASLDSSDNSPQAGRPNHSDISFLESNQRDDLRTHSLASANVNASKSKRPSGNHSARLKSPFKTPSRLDGASSTHSSAPSSMSLGIKRTRLGGGISLSSSSKSKSTGSEKSQIAKLEARARTLRDAVKLLKKRHEDDEVEAITEQWLAAGREMVERLFAIVPEPETNPFLSSNTKPWEDDIHQAAHGNGHIRSYDSSYSALISEQKDVLAHAKRDQDGNPLDHDGNLLLGDTDDEDIATVLEQETKFARQRNTGKRYIPGHWTESKVQQQDTEEAEDRIGAAKKQQIEVEVDRDPTIWNEGRMMVMMSVDPALLGWNEQTEAWDQAHEFVW